MKFQFAHNNFNVRDLDRSLAFYREALGLEEVRRIAPEDGSFIIVYLGDGVTPHILELTYVTNTGAAFSIFSEHTWALALVSLVMSAVLALALWKGLFKHPLGRLALTLLLAGAVGNLIDRALRGFVVDMFNVLFMRFAVFNVADVCVVVGGIAAGAYYLFLMDKLEPREEKSDDGADR